VVDDCSCLDFGDTQFLLTHPKTLHSKSYS
jgi:hypothetical protein